MVGADGAGRAWWVAVVCGMASYIDASAIAGFSSSVVIFQGLGMLSPAQVGIASACLTIGIAVGALVGGRLGDRLGRRPLFLATVGMIVIAAAMLLFADTVTTIIPAALVMGLGVGADLPVSLATISEAAGEERRGRLLVFSNILWITGIAATLGLVTIVGDRGADAVRIIFAHVGVVAAVVLLARLSIPESRAWRIAREERRAGLATVRAQQHRARALLARPYLAPFLGLIVFYAMTNLIANTNGQFGPYVLVNYGGTTVAEAGRILIISIPLGIIGFLWFMRIADRGVVFAYFRVGAVCGVSSPLVLAVFGVSPASYIAALVLGAVGNVFAFEAVMKIWTQQSFPTLLRGTAQGAIIATARLVAAGFAAVTPLVLQVGPAVLYVVIATAGAVGVVVAWIVFRDRVGESAFLHEQETIGAAATPGASAAPTPSV
ncbi:MFS transporter [Microbacterium sp. HJ5]